ncbi:hypothetical protein CN563_13165 [Bacillus sp. AFS026049]|nr:hypothetical protein CN563_13165 [Bacillus sp. AFS026049]
MVRSNRIKFNNLYHVGDTTLRMQIKEIVLYNIHGEIRKLNFKPGKVNIITGKSKTGKSAIAAIIEYCLGRSEFLIPEGVIRQKVAWYAVKLQVNDVEIFIAKEPPGGNGLSQSQVFLKVEKNIEDPNISELIPNTNDTALVQYLGQLIGISSNKHNPGVGSTRDSLEANFKHSRIFLFQKQSVIADETVLFHRQQEDYIPQSIKDTLPYFLGAVREDHLKVEEELRMTKRELKRLLKRIMETEMLSGKGITKAINLIEEAKQVGIIDNEQDIKDDLNVIEVLSGALDWRPSSTTDFETEELFILQESRQNLISELEGINEKIRAAESYADEATGFATEIDQQRLRLESIGLFNDENDGGNQKCPLCSSNLDEEIPTVKLINNSLSELRENLEEVTRERPKLRTYIEVNKREGENLKQKVAQIDSSIESLLYEKQVTEEIKDLNNRKSRVQGRISLFLDNYTEIKNEDIIEQQVKILESRISYLEEILEDEKTEELLFSILSRISKYMSIWAGDLGLEYAESPYRLDIKNLTVVADQQDRPIPMYRMGSGENWLGCHIISHLALHKFFIEKHRPLPSFLILDQPTQVYFPPEKYKNMEGDTKELTDEDRQAVTTLFNLLFKVCEELAPDLQIIILDHANLDNDKFQKALVEQPWRNGSALIPTDWI